MTTSLFQENAFYYETTRRLITSFGQLFQGIQIQKYDAQGQKQQVLRVPCEYGPKNKWLENIKSRPDFEQGVEITMPRLAYEIVDYRYDAARRVGTKGSYQVGNIGDKRTKLFAPVPYDVHINMYSLCKDQTDSLQILEQILPYFAPSLTISMEILPVFKLIKDIPIVLQGVSVEDSYEGSPEQLRTVVQTFSMIAQLDYFPPVNPKSAIIKHTNVGVSTTYAENIELSHVADVVPDTANVNDSYIITEDWLSNF